MQCKLQAPSGMLTFFLRLTYQMDRLKLTWVCPSIWGSLLSPLVSYYPSPVIQEHTNIRCCFFLFLFSLFNFLDLI